MKETTYVNDLCKAYPVKEEMESVIRQIQLDTLKWAEKQVKEHSSPSNYTVRESGDFISGYTRYWKFKVNGCPDKYRPWELPGRISDKIKELEKERHIDTKE